MARRDEDDDRIGAADAESNSEGSPLLSQGDFDPAPSSSSDARARLGSGIVKGRDEEAGAEAVEGETDDEPEPPHLHQQNVVILLFAVIFLVELGAGMIIPASNAIMEDVICRTYLPAAEVGGAMLMDDPRCKTPDIQGSLAMIRGWGTAFDTIPSIICSIPFGLMADKYGRRPIMLVAWLGLILSIASYLFVLGLPNVFPLWTIYLSSAFLLIGGFNCTGPALVYTCIADVLPQARRATGFFRVQVAFLAAELIASPLSGWLMAVFGAWFPSLVGLAVICLSMATIFFLPETLRPTKQHRVDTATDPLSSSDDEEEEGLVRSANHRRTTRKATTAATKTGILREALTIARGSFAEMWTFVLGNTRLVLLMIPLMFFLLGRLAQEVLLQYATKRYGITWSRATIIMAIRSASNLAIFVVVLPALSYLCLNRLGMSALAKDLWLSRLTAAVGAFGAFLVALSVSPVMLSVSLVFFSFGYGFSPLIRSLLNALVESHHLAMLNSALSFLELLGIMIAGPGLSAAMSAGLRMGGAWVGLPFMLAGLAFAASSAMVWAFKLPPEQRRRVD